MYQRTFLAIVTLLASLAQASSSENVVTLKSMDSIDRTVYFTPNAGLDAIEPVAVKAGASVDVTFPHGWIGNYYAVSEGNENKPGMLGEVAFNGWNSLTYFDVSAIVDPTDHEGVAEMWPATGEKPTSGCNPFPCDNAYYLWDDVQTKTTPETHIITTLGKTGYSYGSGNNGTTNGTSSYKYEDDDSKNVKRSFVEGKWF